MTDKQIMFYDLVDADIWHWWNESIKRQSVLNDRNFTDQEIAELFWQNKLGIGKS
jgi:hypothetical protein